MANTVQVILKGVDQFSATFGKATKDFNAFRAVAVSSAVAIAGALTAATASALAFNQQAINLADETGKAAQRAGAAVEQFSALAYAGKLADVSMEDLVNAAKGWSRAVADGKTDTTDLMEGMLQLSDRFAAMADGNQKVTLAVEAFGRAGQKLIPLLNDGSEALREQFEEAQRFGLVIGPGFAANAEQFNDNLTRMRSMFQGLWHQVADQTLPTLLSFSQTFLDFAKDSSFIESTIDVLTKSILTLAEVVLKAAEAYIFFSSLLDGKGFSAIGAELLALQNRIDGLYESFGQPLPLPSISAASEAERADHYQSLADEFMQRWMAVDNEFEQQRQKVQGEYMTQVQLLANDELLVEKDKNFLIEQERSLLSRKLLKIEEEEAKARQRIQAHNAQGMATIFGNLASVAAAFGKKGFEAFKAFRIAEAIASTYAGAARALADYPYPLSVAIAASVVAAGIANVATIASTKPGGQAHAGLGYVPEDATYAISRGERVLAPAQNTDLTRFLESTQAGGAGGQTRVTVLLGDRTLIDLIAEASRDGRLEIDARSIT